MSAELSSVTEPIAEIVPEVADTVAADAPAIPAAELPPASPDQRAAIVESVRTARELPPGVRERLRVLVQQSPTLDATGEPLLATRQVLDLLAQGLPPVLRTVPSFPPQRPDHPAGDAFFAVDSDELSDQQADEIARTQLARAGLLRTE